MTPARETGTGVVGFSIAGSLAAMAPLATVTGAAEVARASVVVAVSEDAASVVAATVDVAPAGLSRVTVTKAVGAQAEDSTTGSAIVWGAEVDAAASVVVSSAAEVAAVVVAATDEAFAFPPAAPPKVKDWVAAPDEQDAESSTLPVTARHVPGVFSGAKESGPEPPLKANS